MQAISRSFGMLWDALFLQTDAYERMRDDDNPFVEGLFLLVLLGLVLAVVGIVGTTLEWASSPPLADVQQAVLGGLQQMPWYQELQAVPEALTHFRSIWDQVWRAVEFAVPKPVTSLTGIITEPLGLIVGWLVFGLVAYVLARVLGGKGTLNQTLGATALGAAPQLLTIVTVLPFAAVAGLGTWTLLCNYMALRTVHHLSWPRAVFAALLPPVVIGLIVVVLFGCLAAVFGTAIATMVTGGLQ
jgi:hypothetical protein